MNCDVTLKNVFKSFFLMQKKTVQLHVREIEQDVIRTMTLPMDLTSQAAVY